MTSQDMRSSGVLVWFREDLRLADNPALDAAVRSGGPVTALYVLDDDSKGPRPLGGAARWWLAQSLRRLQADCEALGLPFAIRSGGSVRTVMESAAEAKVGKVVWNRRYAAAEARLDSELEDRLHNDGFEVETFGARLLNEPWEVRSKSGDPLKVYSPYWRAALARGEPRAPLPKPTKAKIAPGARLGGTEVDALALEPTKPDWAGGLKEAWEPGEAGARKALKRFIEDGLKGYAQDRDRPDKPSTSRMSPYLRFGEVSPHQLWHAVEQARSEGPATGRDVEKFRSELGWREFSYHLLHTHPDLATKNFQERFDDFPWKKPDPKHRRAWRTGMTGFPIVDAGMRQLWTTGWMHNRVRMIAASFLIKDLLIDWREGEDWFWDTLVDADPANNAASWQWVAGSGADAAPYFRVFNPSLQGAKFDPSGDYVRAFVPELKKLPAKHIHSPWEAPEDVLAEAGVELGRDYPKPVVDHGAARDRALAAFDRLKARSA
jgi:deoxyribodipyrimidine photo-lyase